MAHTCPTAAARPPSCRSVPPPRASPLHCSPPPLLQDHYPPAPPPPPPTCVRSESPNGGSIVTAPSLRRIDEFRKSQRRKRPSGELHPSPSRVWPMIIGQCFIKPHRCAALTKHGSPDSDLLIGRRSPITIHSLNPSLSAPPWMHLPTMSSRYRFSTSGCCQSQKWATRLAGIHGSPAGPHGSSRADTPARASS